MEAFLGVAGWVIFLWWLGDFVERHGAAIWGFTQWLIGVGIIAAIYLWLPPGYQRAFWIGLAIRGGLWVLNAFADRRDARMAWRRWEAEQKALAVQEAERVQMELLANSYGVTTGQERDPALHAWLGKRDWKPRINPEPQGRKELTRPLTGRMPPSRRFGDLPPDLRN